jgi:hypothetical protein
MNQFDFTSDTFPPRGKYRISCPICQCERRFFFPTHIIDTVIDHCDSIRVKSGKRTCIGCSKPNDKWRICPYELATDNKKVSRFRCQECHDIVQKDADNLPRSSRFDPHAPVFT